MTAPTDHAPWAPITVPGNWTMQAVGRAAGDLPHYTNIVMPFGGDPPNVPPRPIAGLYRRTLTRTELRSARALGRDRRCVLHIGGADSVAAVWCNGAFIGTMSDSRLPSEFDITDDLIDGPNDLAIMVVRWSAHTWIEDQDHWFHGGLHRRVALRGTGGVGVDDVIVDTRLDADGVNATATVTTRVHGAIPGLNVRARIETLGGRPLRRASGCAPVSIFDNSSQLASMVDAYRHPGPVAVVALKAAPIRPWSHEDPQRYCVIVELVDADGEVIEAVPVVTGFRSVEIRGAELLLNSKPVVIAGVNRHDHHHHHGKSISDDEMRAEVLAIRRAGFNALRTAHYPPDPALLDACDEFGLWVICEANLESHARWNEVINDPRFATSFIERVQRMVSVHRNHPSVMAWSLGNESGYGAVHDAAAALVRRSDPHRVVHYEGSNSEYWRLGVAPADDRASDIECPMYPSVDALIEWATQGPRRPLIMCEYSHAMGNSNGDLNRYWSAIERHRGLQGGFIWDWRDQGLVAPEVTGHHAPIYGGGFGDTPNDAAFCCNGLCGADGTPHPAIEEHRWLTRPVRSTMQIRDGRLGVSVENRWWTLSTSALRAEISLAVDGMPFWRRTARVDVPPQQRCTLTWDDLTLPSEGEITATIRWIARRAKPWAAKDQVVAWDQSVLRSRRWKSPAMDRSGALPPTLVGLGELSLWRAPTDNDGQRSGPLVDVLGPLRRWRRWGLEQLERRTDTVWVTGDGTEVNHHRTVRPIVDGARIVDRIDIPDHLDDLPRVSIHLCVPSTFDQLRWYGRGPWETASDRRAAPLGIWNSSVDEEYIAYAVPQHHGTHIDTRWLELTDGNGNGIRITLRQPGSFDVSRYAPSMLTSARTHADLVHDDVMHLHLDAALRGVGTGACGPDTSVIVPTGRHQLEWCLTQVSSKSSRSRSIA